jgi:hypothetical protein
LRPIFDRTWHFSEVPPAAVNFRFREKADLVDFRLGEQCALRGFSHNERLWKAYCLAHHVTVDGEKRRLMIASLRYLDTFVKIDGAWLFSERRLYVDWIEERALS